MFLGNSDIFCSVVLLWQVLEELNLSMDQFIDVCILCGCDYCEGIRGMMVINCVIVSMHSFL